MSRKNQAVKGQIYFVYKMAICEINTISYGLHHLGYDWSQRAKEGWSRIFLEEGRLGDVIGKFRASWRKSGANQFHNVANTVMSLTLGRYVWVYELAFLSSWGDFRD